LRAPIEAAGGRVDRGERRMRGDRVTVEAILDAHRSGVGRGEPEVVDDGAPVQARPADEQGRRASRVHLRDGRAREVTEPDDA
jgi:hypothetical protein